MHFFQHLISYLLPIQYWINNGAGSTPPVTNNFLLLDGTDFLLLDGTNLLLLG